MADTKKTEAPAVNTGDPELDARLEETLTPEQKQWWNDFVGAKSTGFRFDVEECMRNLREES